MPLGLIVIIMILWKLKGEWVEAKGEKFDLTGSIIYGVSLIARDVRDVDTAAVIRRLVPGSGFPLSFSFYLVGDEKQQPAFKS